MGSIFSTTFRYSNARMRRHSKHRGAHSPTRFYGGRDRMICEMPRAKYSRYSEPKPAPSCPFPVTFSGRYEHRKTLWFQVCLGQLSRSKHKERKVVGLLASLFFALFFSPWVKEKRRDRRHETLFRDVALTPLTNCCVALIDVLYTTKTVP